MDTAAELHLTRDTVGNNSFPLNAACVRSVHRMTRTKGCVPPDCSALWLTSIREVRQEDYPEFEASRCCSVRPCLKT